MLVNNKLLAAFHQFFIGKLNGRLVNVNEAIIFCTSRVSSSPQCLRRNLIVFYFQNRPSRGLYIYINLRLLWIL